MTSKQNKPQGLTVSTHRQNALHTMSPLDSILPVKKRSLRTNTLSDVTPASPAGETKVINGSQKLYKQIDSNKKTLQKKITTQKKLTKKMEDLDSDSDSDNSDTEGTSGKKGGDLFQQYYNSTETWNVIKERKIPFKKQGMPSNYIKTMVKNSKQDPSEKIDEKLYSSLKYVLLHKIEPDYFTDENGDAGFILCRVQVVCPETGEEIRRNGEGVLGGSIESSLRMDAVTHMKIQFTSCSSHHDKKQFAFRLQYFLNSDLKDPILVKQSTPFLVYARKKTGAKRKKRSKSKSDSKDFDDDIIEPVLKRPKIIPHHSEEEKQLLDYSTIFNKLATEIDRIKKEYFDRLPDSEKSHAKSVVAEKLNMQFSTNSHLISLMGHSGYHSIPHTIGTINTPATPSGLFSGNTSSLLTPLQTPNPDGIVSGAGQSISLLHHEDHHHHHLHRHSHVSDTDDHDDDHDMTALGRLETPTDIHLDNSVNYI